MAAKRFNISTPEELREINEFVKDGKLSSMVSVWTVTKRRQGETRWDKAIYACFSGDKRRVAAVVRIAGNGEIVQCATLRYNLALNWSEQHLREVYD